VKCDHCENEATVHEWTKKAGQKIEKHLCEECARKQGVAIQPQQQISQLITQLIGNTKPGAPAAVLHPTVQVGACPVCSTTYAQFRHSGLLGCPTCYRVFESQLGPLLQRAHEGGTHHTGKAPATLPAGALAHQPAEPPGPPTPSDQELARLKAEAENRAKFEKAKRLREELTQAIAAEQYEKAAGLRDQLQSLDPKPPGAAPIA
jgi:protein arginine kinase activator